ncbi:MAG: hypothetical protein ACSHX8_11435 [Opitutaceae bacterium]
MPFRLHATISTLFILTCLNSSAQNFSWDSGGNNTKYETAENWSTDVLPFSTGEKTMALEIADGGTVTFDRRTGKQVIDLLSLDNGSTLNMTGGEFDHSRSGAIVRTSIGTLGTGTSTFNQSGGTMEIGHLLRLGDRKASGIYNLSGGSLTVYRGGRTLIGAPDGASISLGSRGAVAEFNISGGSLVTRGGVEIDSNASFKVLGSRISRIAIGDHKASDHGFWYQRGTLSIGIGPYGVTPIQITSGDSQAQFARFLEGAELDLGFYETEPLTGTWTLLEIENAKIDDEGLVLSAATIANGDWSFNVDNSGPNGRLLATYGDYVSIPEPLSCSFMLGAFCLFILNIRRKAR